MHRSLKLAGIILAIAGADAAAADPARDQILETYAAAAKAADPAFAGFSAERGEALYVGPHQGGDPTACAGCHTRDPRAMGQHYRTGRAIEPMAVSANPSRFTDPEEVEKQFSRDCKKVLGRSCTASEKGDFITFLSGR